MAHVRTYSVPACGVITLSAVLFAVPELFGQQAQFQGSVATGVASPTPITVTLHNAIERGLRANLGLLLSGQGSEVARAARLRSFSALLPQVTGEASENVQQIDLKTHGINFHLPGFSTPAVVGPFHFTDARAYASFSVFDYSLRKSYHAAQENERAAQLSFKDARDLVVQSVANAYLLVIAGSSRAQALRAQVETDQAVYDRTADPKRAGTTASIDVLRARVELQQERQRLIAQDDQVAKDKLLWRGRSACPQASRLRSRALNPTRRWPGSLRIRLYISPTSSALTSRAQRRPCAPLRIPLVPRALSAIQTSAQPGIAAMWGQPSIAPTEHLRFKLLRKSASSTADEFAAML